MIPNDGLTHSMLLSYHAGIEDDLPEPTLTASEVEAEILLDEWMDLIAGNGDWAPHQRTTNRRPMLDEGEDDS